MVVSLGGPWWAKLPPLPIDVACVVFEPEEPLVEDVFDGLLERAGLAAWLVDLSMLNERRTWPIKQER
jgi:hypothetical protein